MSGREPDWDINRLRGKEAEIAVRRMRSALLIGEVEVKCDDAAFEYRNAYIEYACNTAAGWKPSGIAETKAQNYAIVIGRTITWMPTWMLKIIAREYGTKRECRQGSHPTKGVVIPVGELLPRAMEVLTRPAVESSHGDHLTLPSP